MVFTVFTMYPRGFDFKVHAFGIMYFCLSVSVVGQIEYFHYVESSDLHLLL